MITAEGLTKRFGAFTAIEDVSFSVARGEIIGFLGPNGAGKSTTMRILAGVFPPTSGSANIAGFDVVRQSLQARATVGYFPERVSIYLDMSVDHYLRYVAQMKGRKIAIIGDMKELGRESARFHQELGAAMSETAVDLVIAVGPECAHLVARCGRPVAHFASIDAAREYVMESVGEGDVVLLKGSRVMGLEKAVKFIAEKMTQTRPRVAV